MAKFTHLMIHCAFTKAMQSFTAQDILEWHLAPRDVTDKHGNQYTVYKGKRYQSRMDLPAERLNGKEIFGLHGRGWRKPGYRDVIERDGSIVNLVPYNMDDHIESWEISNGARGWNGHTAHVCLMGGLAKDGKSPEMNFNDFQLKSLDAYCKTTLRLQPYLKVIGHNQVDPHKTCPSFIVPIWAKFVGIKDENIDFKNHANNPFFEKYLY